jgi:hypothetical protein
MRKRKNGRIAVMQLTNTFCSKSFRLDFEMFEVGEPADHCDDRQECDYGYGYEPSDGTESGTFNDQLRHYQF